MNELQKFFYFKKIGYRCSLAGKVFGPRGEVGYLAKDKGYLKICARVGKKTIYGYAHRFVFFWFYGNVPEVVWHKDNNKLNNRFSNLEARTFVGHICSKKER
jgi:hypothetical protein